MAVVINDFEVLPPPQADAGKSASTAASTPPASDKVEPKALAAALRVLHKRALRAWAH